MFDVSRNSTEQERTILRKLRIWIAALAVACLVAGIGIGAMLSGRPAVAQPDVQIARAPEALSASFAEIARRVEPAVVNIETTQVQVEISEKDEDKEDQDSSNPLLDMFRTSPTDCATRHRQRVHRRSKRLHPDELPRDPGRRANHRRTAIR